MGKQSNKEYEGKLDETPSFTIYLNISHLKKGNYTLHIIDHTKTIKTIKFKKTIL